MHERVEAIGVDGELLAAGHRRRHQRDDDGVVWVHQQIDAIARRGRPPVTIGVIAIRRRGAPIASMSSTILARPGRRLWRCHTRRARAGAAKGPPYRAPDPGRGRGSPPENLDPRPTRRRHQKNAVGMIGIGQDIDAIAGARHPAEIDELGDGDPPRHLAGARESRTRRISGTWFSVVPVCAMEMTRAMPGSPCLMTLRFVRAWRNIRSTIGMRNKSMTTGTGSGKKAAMLSMTVTPPDALSWSRRGPPGRAKRRRSILHEPETRPRRSGCDIGPSR